MKLFPPPPWGGGGGPNMYACIAIFFLSSHFQRSALTLLSKWFGETFLTSQLSSLLWHTRLSETYWSAINSARCSQWIYSGPLTLKLCAKILISYFSKMSAWFNAKICCLKRSRQQCRYNIKSFYIDLKWHGSKLFSNSFIGDMVQADKVPSKSP